MTEKNKNIVSFGDECKIILPDNLAIKVNMNTFDELEYSCMDLITKYAEFFGARVVSSSYDEETGKDNEPHPISFNLAKSIQDVILEIFEGVGLYFVNANAASDSENNGKD